MKLTTEMKSYLVSTIIAQRIRGHGTSDSKAQKMYERFCKKFNLEIGGWNSESFEAFHQVLMEIVDAE